MRGFRLFVGIMLVCISAVAQDYLAVPTSNPALFGENFSYSSKEKLEVFEENFIYLYDTLDLPFIDDFSTNRQRQRITDLSNPRLKDSLFYRIRLANGPL